MSIANFIREDMAARLKSGRELPVQQLTLDSLAEHYKVSLSPVRTAVANLINDGLLEKGSNRRLAASTPPNGKTPEDWSATLPEPPCNPFEAIKNDLVQLSLKGNPVYLREEAMAQKYGVSRSVIRNILYRLAGEAMLDHIPRRGWQLRPFYQEDLQAYIEVREVLEIKALNLALPKLDPGELQRILDANAPPRSSSDRPPVDESLHEYIVNTAGNDYIKDFFERRGRYYGVLFDWEDRDYETATETARQHREILTALLQRQWPAARKALSHHILNNHPILTRIALKLRN